MSVIGYFISCTRCEIKMIVTVEAKHSRHCPECLNDLILEAIDSIDDEPEPPRQPYTEPLLPWERELLGRNDDDDYPIGQVQG